MIIRHTIDPLKEENQVTSRRTEASPEEKGLWNLVFYGKETEGIEVDEAMIKRDIEAGFSNESDIVGEYGGAFRCDWCGEAVKPGEGRGEDHAYCSLKCESLYNETYCQ